jgi:ABC-2 type transport system permease protein
MAVYEQTYKSYTGPLTAAWSRFFIIPRYAYEVVFRSKLFVGFFALCFAIPFIGLILIYLKHNVSALQIFGASAGEIANQLPIGNTFFYYGMWYQGALAFLLTLFVGPALVAPDLRNNGLALYLSRPFTRTEYIFGKMSVLLILLSAITWIPGLILFAFQSYLDGAGWFGNNLSIGWAIFIGSWVWILFLSLFVLAVSAWVKWKPVARITLMGFFFVLMGFGATINEVLNVWWGMLLSAWHIIGAIWWSLFDMGVTDELPPAGPAWFALAAGTLLCLWLLYRRVRAYEVVR